MGWSFRGQQLAVKLFQRCAITALEQINFESCIYFAEIGLQILAMQCLRKPEIDYEKQSDKANMLTHHVRVSQEFINVDAKALQIMERGLRVLAEKAPS